MTTTYEARTAYGVPIRMTAPFESRSEALKWAYRNTDTFPGLRIVAKAEGMADAVIWTDRASMGRAA